MRKKTLTLFLLSAIPFLAIAGAGLQYGSGHQRTGNVITYTKLGFEPDQIILPQGSLVEFRNQSDVPVWPASNIHPAHTEYPGFDPLKTIAPGESWSFRFNQAGEWHYHNHIGSNYSPDTGSVIVYPPGSDPPDITEPSIEYCAGLSETGRFYCWIRLLSLTQRNKGTLETFSLLQQLYKQDPYFGNTCNDMTHRIGGQAYGINRSHLTDIITPETLFCNAGFYHGLMEVFISSTKNIDKAAQFCDEVEKRLGYSTIIAPTACYHGIGHGTMELLGIHSLVNWDSIGDILSRGIEICGSYPDVYRTACVNGIFSAVFMHYRDLPQDSKRSDPYWFCPSVSPVYQRFCYESMSANLYWNGKRDIGKSVTFIQSHVPKEQQQYALRTVLQEISFETVKNSSWDDVIRDCKKLDTQLMRVCIKSFVEGLIDNGEPNMEHQQGVRFCNSPVLLTAERDSCFSNLVSYVTGLYSRGNPAGSCELFEPQYRKYCEL